MTGRSRVSGRLVDVGVGAGRGLAALGPARPRRTGGGTVATWPPHLRSVVKATLRLSAGRQTATARAGHAVGSCPPHPADSCKPRSTAGEHDAPSNRVLPVPGVVPTHQPPVPASRRPAVHREPGPPRAYATPRPSRTRAAGHHAPPPYRAQRHLTSGVGDREPLPARRADAPAGGWAGLPLCRLAQRRVAAPRRRGVHHLAARAVRLRRHERARS